MVWMISRITARCVSPTFTANVLWHRHAIAFCCSALHILPNCGAFVTSILAVAIDTVVAVTRTVIILAIRRIITTKLCVVLSFIFAL